MLGGQDARAKGQDAEIDQQTACVFVSTRCTCVGAYPMGSKTQKREKMLTVAVFWKTSHVLHTFKHPSQQSLNGFDEGVRDPACELVERDERVGFGFGVACFMTECGTGPDVPEGDTV